jgi:hypothetical protein
MALCERCGKPGTVHLSSVPANRAGVVQTATEHLYCSDCARAAGVPIPDRRTHASDEHAPPDWAGLQEFYEMMARIPLTNPVQRGADASDAAELLRMMDHFPEHAPPELRALLERVARRAT